MREKKEQEREETKFILADVHRKFIFLCEEDQEEARMTCFNKKRRETMKTERTSSTKHERVQVEERMPSDRF
jgi:hypothetical protein